MATWNSGWPVIREHYGSLKQLMAVYRSGVEQRGDAFDQELNRSLNLLLRRIYRFLSCALLAFEQTEASLCKRMKRLGFRVELPPPLNLDTMVLILSGVAIWVFGVTFAMAATMRLAGWHDIVRNTMIPLDNMQDVLGWSITAFLFHGSTVSCVLSMKRMLAMRRVWPVLDEPIGMDDRRWLIYLLMGFLGFLIATTLLASVSLFYDDFQWSWGFLAASTGAFLAYHIDTHPSRARPALQTASQALGTGAAAYVCSMLVLELGGFVPGSARDIGLVAFLVSQAALTGGFIGLWVPFRFRVLVHGRQAEAGTEAVDGPPGAVPDAV